MAESERRLEDLEVKVAFQEHTIIQLDDVLRALRDELDQMRVEMGQLREQVLQQAEDAIDEKPPHY